MSQDLPWPPPGIHLAFEYQADAATAALGTNIAYAVLWKDNFSETNNRWKIHTSSSHPRNSFINEGKFGEIMADANSAVYAEQELPKGSVGAIALIDPGTDAGASYGPGLALVWPELSAKLHLRPEQKQIGVSINGHEVKAIPAKIEPTYLRIARNGATLVFEASANGSDWNRIHEYTGKIPETSAPLVRVGKLSKAAEGTDHRDRGAVERSFVREVAALGKPQTGSANPLQGLKVIVHYELYDGLPLLGKWLTIRNDTSSPVTVDKFTSEILGVTEVESAVEDKHAQPWVMPQILPVTDYAFGSMTGSDATRQSVHWESDPDYKTQVNYMRRTPALLRISPEVGPRQTIAAGETFESFRAWLLLQDSRDRERAGLAERRMYRTLAPWVTENPVMMHVRRADDAAVRLAIDQCAEVGFEMVILTFGSGFNFENRDLAYQDRFKALADYAHTKKIALGGYSLLSSRNADPRSDNCVTPKATHGVMPCLGAKWGRDYLAQLKGFTERAGLDILEHDGSYPGDTCASTTHPHHHNYDDSQWVQWRTITDYYRWCRANGVYLNIPDWYYLNGGSKCGMGYREANWSLPRAEQEIVERQNIYDGTWTKTPSMGWMFVPLTEYQGGGAAATIEPLKDHLPHYETRLANLFGAGVQACYRGPRLYDTDETKALVKKWVEFYKTNRAILDSDLIHLRRADGRDWDGWLHVNPQLKICGLAMFYNPLEQEITRTIKLPLYYTGLTNTANVSIGENSPQKSYK
ncbi:MAG: hypothetical protein LBV12_01175, partial [Puniceicoccales bacterium]|nr:hypothetical protein [Puniceicoccales bacterium]